MFSVTCSYICLQNRVKLSVAYYNIDFTLSYLPVFGFSSRVNLSVIYYSSAFIIELSTSILVRLIELSFLLDITRLILLLRYVHIELSFRFDTATLLL